MYRGNKQKRYDIEIAWKNLPSIKFTQAKLLAIKNCFIALVDKNGKEHIYAGDLTFFISES